MIKYFTVNGLMLSFAEVNTRYHVPASTLEAIKPGQPIKAYHPTGEMIIEIADYVVMKEFSFNNGDHKYYASLIQRDGRFEAFTQTDTIKPYVAHYDHYSDALRIFNNFIKNVI